MATVASLLTRKEHPFYDLLHKRRRYKVYYGGRGAAKSWAFAEALIRRATREPLLVLATREYQNSIADSVHRILVNTINRLGLASWFKVTDKSIKSIIGAEFIFKGLQDIASLKSLEGVDVCWVAEAQDTTEDSWRTLIPTIRKKGSEIWVEFNTTDEQAPTYVRFVTPTIGDTGMPDPAKGRRDAIVHKVNFTENPFFRDTELQAEMEYDRENDFEAYLHIWEGMPKKMSDAIIFGKRVRIAAFDAEKIRQYALSQRYFQGADFGFSQDPSTLIRSLIDEKTKTLYICSELYKIGVEIDDMPEWYRLMPDADKWPIRADNARPETISYLKRHGFQIKAAEKWKGSVEDGIAHLKGFKEIVIHPDCKHMIQEARLYAFKVDPKTGDVLPDIIDKHNHCWDALRYSLDGYIRRRGSEGVWAKLAR